MSRVAHSLLAMLVGVPLIGACSGGDVGAVPSGGETVPVASDPSARYRLLEWRVMANSHREAITRRDGPSGTSFSRREIDCAGRRSRYLGEGDTLEDARSDSATVGEMETLVAGSISTEVSRFVCAK